VADALHGPGAHRQSEAAKHQSNCQKAFKGHKIITHFQQVPRRNWALIISFTPSFFGENAGFTQQPSAIAPPQEVAESKANYSNRCQNSAHNFAVPAKRCFSLAMHAKISYFTPDTTNKQGKNPALIQTCQRSQNDPENESPRSRTSNFRGDGRGARLRARAGKPGLFGPGKTHRDTRRGFAAAADD
jgi:hypothetical protein